MKGKTVVKTISGVTITQFHGVYQPCMKVYENGKNSYGYFRLTYFKDKERTTDLFLIVEINDLIDHDCFNAEEKETRELIRTIVVVQA